MMERFNIRYKSPTGRFLTPAGRTAVRLERAMLGNLLTDIAARYGITPERASRITAGLPARVGDDQDATPIFAAVRERWQREENADGKLPEIQWQLTLLDALALCFDLPSVSSSAIIEKVMIQIGTIIPAKETSDVHSLAA